MQQEALDVRLRRLKLSEKLLKDLVLFSKADTKNTNMLNEDRPTEQVDMGSIRQCLHRRKIYRMLSKYYIFNIVITDMEPDVYHFICKDVYGKIYSLDLPKKDFFKYSLALLSAVEYFIPLARDNISEQLIIHEKNQKKLQYKGIRLPANTLLTDEITEGLLEVLENLPDPSADSDDNAEEIEFEEVVESGDGVP